VGKDVVFGSLCREVWWAEVGAAGVTCRAPHVVGDIQLFSVQCLG
jgi:hypothetical protein